MEIGNKIHRIILYQTISETIPLNYKKYNYSLRLPFGEEITNSIWKYCNFK